MMSSFLVSGRAALRAAAVMMVMLLLLTSLLALAAGLQQKDPKEQCIFNLKQLWMGLRTYVDDYDDTFPYVGTTSGKLAWSPGGVVWEQPLTPYVKEWSFLACPKAGATTAKPYTYFFSRRLSGESWGAVQYPPLCLIVGDWVAHGSDPGPSDPSTTWDIARTKKAAPAGSWLAGERHAGAGTAPGGAVYAFVDGHVKLLRRPDILPSNTVTPPPGIDIKPSFYP